jgi:hypothetical protein
MVAVVILASVAGAVFLAGAVLFVIGLLQPNKRRAADSTSILSFLVRNTFKVLFPPPGTSYPRGQRMMAGGLMLIALSILLGLGAVGASLTQGGSTKSSFPTIAPVTTTQR